MNSRVVRFLAILRDSVPDAQRRYTQGGCWQLFCMLRVAWPQARPWYDHGAGHVISEIDGRFYDISGRVHNPSAMPMTDEPDLIRQAHRWGYKHD